MYRIVLMSHLYSEYLNILHLDSFKTLLFSDPISFQIVFTHVRLCTDVYRKVNERDFHNILGIRKT